MKYVIGTALMILALLCFSMAITSCASFDRETIAKLNEMKAKEEALLTEMDAAAKFVAETKKEIVATIEDYKAGGISKVDFVNLLSSLNERLAQGQEHLQQVKNEYEVTKDEVKALRESGVPWWQIAIWLALGAFNVATGKGYLKEKDNGKIADLAISGIGSLVGALEKVYVKKYHNEEVREALKAVKIKVSNIHNPIIEAEVSKLPTPTIIEPPPEEEPPAEVNG